MNCDDDDTYCLPQCSVVQCAVCCAGLCYNCSPWCCLCIDLYTISLDLVYRVLTLTPFGSIDVQEKLSSMLMRLDQLAPTAFMPPIRCPPSAPDGPTWGGIKPTMICKDNRSRTVAEGLYRGFFGPFVGVDAI